MDSKINKIIGKHLLAEFVNCQESLDDINFIRNNMEEAAIRSKSTIVESVFHHFSPYGVSGVVVIAESHLTIHTWPEIHYAAIDIFTCADKVNPWIALNFLKQSFKAEYIDVKELTRGYPSLFNKKIASKNSL